MKRWLCVWTVLFLSGMLTACGNQDTSESAQGNVPQTASASTESKEDDAGKELSEDHEESTMKVIVGDTVFTATLADNSSAQALKELIAEEPLTISMSDYGNME